MSVDLLAPLDPVLAGVDAMLARFTACRTAREHLALVDERETRRKMEWLQKHRRETWRRDVYPVINVSWTRLYAAARAAAAQ